jgi:hypothetical protein
MNQPAIEVIMSSSRRRRKMLSNPSHPTYRKNAVVAGILFIVCTAASILSLVPTSGLLEGQGWLTGLAAHEGRVVAGALITFLWAASGAGIAVALYPALRKHNRSLALGAVAGRVVEGALVLVAALGLLTLLSVSQKAGAAGPADANSLQAVADSLLATRDWSLSIVATLCFVIGALMYYSVLYRARIVPRWLSGWGLVGALLALGVTIYSAFIQDFGFSTANTVLNIPIAIQEMVLAVWLIAKGFRAPAVASYRPAQIEAATV